jgi:hypothetical protein
MRTHRIKCDRCGAEEDLSGEHYSGPLNWGEYRDYDACPTCSTLIENFIDSQFKVEKKS